MRTIIATVTVSEMGDVKTVTITDDSTYEVSQLISMYGMPYLGSYESSEDWRKALGASLTDYVAEYFKASGCHGDKLVYVSPACSVYVYEIDFDR